MIKNIFDRLMNSEDEIEQKPKISYEDLENRYLALKNTNEQLQRYNSRLLNEKLELNSKYLDSKFEIEKLENKLNDSVSKEQYNNDLEFWKLRCKGYEIANQQHNKRGAGRKSRFTNNDIQTALRLRREGMSLGKITEYFNENTNRKWSKSTIQYLLDKYKTK